MRNTAPSVFYIFMILFFFFGFSWKGMEGDGKMGEHYDALHV